MRSNDDIDDDIAKEEEEAEEEVEERKKIDGVEWWISSSKTPEMVINYQFTSYQ